MASGTSVLKLTVDDSEYNASLKEAQQGLQQLGQALQNAGKSFDDVDSKVVDYVRSIGQMEAVSKSARGRIGEMSTAFVNLSMEYNKMTEQEKQSPVGKALAESLSQLRERTISAKEELANLNKQLEPVNQKTTETGGVMGMLKDKLTVNIDAMKLFSVGLQAAKAALDVAKDAFFNNEQQLDDWGRTVESAQSLYNGFLNALNTGDISGYLKNIDDITRAARAAYDALDALNTFNAFNQINVEKTRTGMTESIASYREGTGSREEVKAAGEAYKKELQERKKLEREAYIEAVGKVAAERGVSKEDLLTALSGTYGSYQQLKNMPMSGQQIVNYGNSMFGGGGSYIKEVPNSVQEKLGDALRKLNDTELQSLQALGAQAERTGNEIASVDKQLTRVLNGRQGGAGGSNNNGGNGGGRVATQTDTFAADSIAYQEKLVQELTRKWREAGAAVRDDYARQLGEAKQTLSEMNGGFTPDKLANISNIETPNLTQGAELTLPAKLEIQSPVEQWKEQITSLQEAMNSAWSTDAITIYQNEIDTLQKKIEKFTGKTDGESMAKDWQSAANAIGQVGSAMQQIEDPAAKVMGIVAQAIATIALTYAKSLEGTFTPWDWIAGAASGLATMISTISAIKSATAGSYAEGGIIPGNHYSGDQQWAQVNAGELILNRSQQNSIAAQLQDTERGGYTPSHISGEQIYIALNRYTRRTGKGELVTWR